MGNGKELWSSRIPRIAQSPPKTRPECPSSSTIAETTDILGSTLTVFERSFTLQSARNRHWPGFRQLAQAAQMEQS
jgi:hypothetical protein